MLTLAVVAVVVLGMVALLRSRVGARDGLGTAEVVLEENGDRYVDM
jgi:hypothetical protein